MTFADRPEPVLRSNGRRTRFPVASYQLDATLSSGQVFRWESDSGAWEGVVGSRWVRLSNAEGGLLAETCEEIQDWDWLAHYLQVAVDLDRVLSEFPNDEPLRQAVVACRGLRLLRQEPWECLASFILSSTKQIVQIRQIIRMLCARFGEVVPVPADALATYSFPRADRLAGASETELRACKMGFRARYLQAAARAVDGGDLDLEHLAEIGTEAARAELLRVPGVGRKIADCVLLFAYGFQDAFPIDVWVSKALRDLYFKERPVRQKELVHFAATHFGPQAGYAQQYLFHYMRVHRGNQPEPPSS